MKDKDRKKVKNETDYMTIGLCLGMSFGAALGQVLFHNLSVGIGTGLCIGLCIGLIADAGKKKREEWTDGYQLFRHCHEIT